MADYLAGFYPEWVDKEENPRQIILDLGKMITNRIPVKLGFQKLNKYDPEYWGLAALLTDEQAEVALKMGVRKPKTMADMVKLTGKSEEELEKILGGYALYKEKTIIGTCQARPTEQGADITALTIVPEWRRKGYGSYLLKEVLRSLGGYDKENATVFTAPLPADAGELAFWAKFGFAAEGSGLCRRRTPDLTAVKLVQDFLAARLADPRLCIDATCGNGGDTAFLCGLTAPAGRVLAFDVQPEAIRSTRARLEQADVPADRYSLICGSHADLLQYVQPGTADAVMFNFGWLPGADHGVFSTAQSSIPALQAALQAVRPGGIVSAILYSGAVIGSDEKQAVLRFLRALPLKSFTVLVCDFANWAETAPLPCLILKK